MSVCRAFDLVYKNGGCTHGTSMCIGSKVLKQGKLAFIAEVRSKFGVYYAVYYADNGRMNFDTFDTVAEAERLFSEASE
mgnify:CR=1 FL=1